MNRILILSSIIFFTIFSCKKLERVNPKDGIAGVTTSEANQLSFSSVEINTNLNKVDGVAYVTQRGICFSQNQNPSTSDLFTNNGSGFGSFTSKIEGLSANTTYYFRSFASNDKAIAYGNEVSFKINAPFIKTKSATSISYTQATIGYSLINPENVSISEKGMFWGVYPGITEQNTKIITDKTDVDYTLSNLENGKSYYYKPFASTNYGYVFGEELSFNTLGYNTPSLSTTQVTSIGEYTAISGGEISSDGGLPITAKGICWSTNSVPTISDSKTSEGTGDASFTSQLTGLQDGTTYYVRAYATNDKGTSYGNEQIFTTYATYKPTVLTTSISSITKTTATSGGTISSDGGLSITAKGICWGEKSNPTISDNKTSDGTGITLFTSQITGLSAGKTYYVRAYAINAKGISYGNEVSFTSVDNTIPTLTTNAITSITKNSAASGGTISSDGGLPITAKGICWSTTSNPTLSDSKTTDGTGDANFTSQMTGLQDGTTYYVRAYATNAKGTSYGNEVSFTALNYGPNIKDIDGNSYKTVYIGSQLWMADNLKASKYNDGTSIANVSDATQWSKLTTGAWCYYNNDAVYNAKYGKLYNWYAVSPTTNGNKNVCPSGWHVPTDAEWTVLTDYLDGESVAGGKMKEVGTTSWNSPNTGATNESGFTGLPGGYRNGGGDYLNIGNFGLWWSSTEGITGIAWYRTLNLLDGYANRFNGNKVGGLSVRCLRD